MAGSPRNWSALRAAIAMIAALRVHARRVGQQRRVVDAQVGAAPHPAEAVGAGAVAVLADAHRRREVHGHEVRPVAGERVPPLHEVVGARGRRRPPVTDGYSSVAPGGEQHLAEVHERRVRGGSCRRR